MDEQDPKTRTARILETAAAGVQFRVEIEEGEGTGGSTKKISFTEEYLRLSLLPSQRLSISLPSSALAEL